ncbi:hypothetical protein BDB01DRAFT_834992 [Pilobolus umbonatus]|nr:hypothetical protein BDB01DRAFT_834992 [Pilobolus umbonatus]
MDSFVDTVINNFLEMMASVATPTLSGFLSSPDPLSLLALPSINIEEEEYFVALSLSQLGTPTSTPSSPIPNSSPVLPTREVPPFPVPSSPSLWSRSSSPIPYGREDESVVGESVGAVLSGGDDVSGVAEVSGGESVGGVVDAVASGVVDAVASGGESVGGVVDAVVSGVVSSGVVEESPLSPLQFSSVYSLSLIDENHPRHALFLASDDDLPLPEEDIVMSLAPALPVVLSPASDVCLLLPEEDTFMQEAEVVVVVVVEEDDFMEIDDPMDIDLYEVNLDYMYWE